MIAFLLDTKIGHLLIGLLCVALALGGGYLKGHNTGFDKARAQDAAQIATCKASNATLYATVGQLKAANAKWADGAKAEQASAAEAVKTMAEQHAKDAEALKHAQTKLADAIQAHGGAHAWAVTPVPDSVLRVLRSGELRNPDGAN